MQLGCNKHGCTLMYIQQSLSWMKPSVIRIGLKREKKMLRLWHKMERRQWDSTHIELPYQLFELLTFEQLSIPIPRKDNTFTKQFSNSMWYYRQLYSYEIGTLEDRRYLDISTMLIGWKLRTLNNILVARRDYYPNHQTWGKFETF